MKEQIIKHERFFMSEFYMILIGIIILLLILLIWKWIKCHYGNKTTNNCTAYLDTPINMPASQVCNMITDFQESQLGTNDAHSVQFSLDELKSFICQIEHKAENVNLNGESLGVRIYFAKYKNNASNTPVGKSNYAGKQTVVLIPTKGDADFIVQNDLMSNYQNYTETYTESINPPSGLNILAKNHGSLIPPINNQTEAFCYTGQVL